MNVQHHRRFPQLAAAFALAALLLSAASWALGESSTASNTAKARLIRPLLILSNKPLNFGTLIKSFASGSDVTVELHTNAGGAPTVTSSNPIGLTPLSGHDEARFFVFGEPGELVQVTIPASFSIKKGAGGTPETEMTVDSLTVVPLNNANQTLPFTDGRFNMPDISGILEVGGKLTVKPANELGEYTGSFSVTVSYV